MTEGAPRWKRVGRIVGMVGGGLVAAGVLAVGLFPTRTFLDQRAATAESEQRLEVIRDQNEAMEQALERLDTDEEIERIAREQYNMVEEGEEAYQILPAPLPPLELPDLWPFGPMLRPEDSGTVAES